MSEWLIVLIIAGLLLIPLAPAAAIYYLLSAKRARERTSAHGDASFGNLSLFGFRVSFEAFGSTGTYLVILALAVGLFLHMQNIEHQESAARAHVAWRVEAPVVIKGTNGQRLDASDPYYKQVRPVINPFHIMEYDTLTFWVVKEHERFPALDLEITNTTSEPINLNDKSTVEVDESNNKLTVKPTTLTLKPPYNAPPSQGPSP